VRQATDGRALVAEGANSQSKSRNPQVRWLTYTSPSDRISPAANCFKNEYYVAQEAVSGGRDAQAFEVADKADEPVNPSYK
jgi:hypothetical protein